MNFTDIGEDLKKEYNSSIFHPLQSFEWGEFRKKAGVRVIRRAEIQKGKVLNGYQFTIHNIPILPFSIGYFPKGDIPSKDLLEDIKNLIKENNIVYVQLEPNVEIGNWKLEIGNSGLRPAFHPLFTKYNFVLDLKKSEDEILKNMHPKTRYNVRLSEKKGVKFEIDNGDKSFKEYLKLTKETTKRQKFYAHNESYHKLMWETLKANNKDEFDSNKLQAHLLKAVYKNKTLVTWVLFTFKDTLYYPYGASSDQYREVMASAGIMWAAIKYGKKLGLSKFDMWGAANVPEPETNDPYFGFHRFKQGFGAEHVEMVGSYDLVINSLNYNLLKIGDKIRWAYLKTKPR